MTSHRSIRPIAKSLQGYALATYYGADRRLLRLVPTALLVLRARLRHGIGPFHFSLLDLGHTAERHWNDFIIMRPGFDADRNALSPGAIQGVVDDKILFYEHCMRANLPTIPIVCRVGGGADPPGRLVEHVEDAARFKALLQLSPSELFVKPVNGAHGDGVFRVTSLGGSLRFEGRAGTAEDLLVFLERRGQAQAGLIIQPQVRPHAAMRPFAAADTLPTIRVITAMSADEPEVLFACLRMPAGRNFTDNFGDGTNGNLVSGIDVGTGTLMQARRSIRRSWPVIESVDLHPDTHHRITGLHVPFWEEIVATVLRGQRSLPRLRTIGWDVAVTQDGVVLVELNSNYGVYSLQVAYRRGLKADLSSKLQISIA